MIYTYCIPIFYLCHNVIAPSWGIIIETPSKFKGVKQNKISCNTIFRRRSLPNPEKEELSLSSGRGFIDARSMAPWIYSN